MRTGIFCALLLFISVCSLAQGDYIVTTKGDTLRGELKLLTYDLMDRVQISVNKKKSTYTALQVRSLSFKGEIYQTQQFENTIRFMKLIKGGYLSYYAFRQASQVTYDGRYLVKRGGSGMEVPNIGFKKGLSAFLEDCEQVASKIKGDSYKRNEIEKIIDDYNSCVQTKTVVVQQAAEAAVAGNEKTDALKALQAKITSLENFSEKKDVTDLLTDISDKIAKQQAVPNYQIEALKGLLAGKDQVKPELDKVITLLAVK